MSVRFAEQSHHPQEVSLDEENLKQRHSEMSQYAISEESHRLSQPWQQLTTELSQFSLSAHSDSTTRESDRPVSIDEFRPLAALSGSSQLEQVADGDPLKWEQNTHLLRSNQEHVSEMADDISRRIEESLAQHRQLVEQTRRIMEERNADTEHQSGDNQFAAQEEEQHLTFGNLKEQTGILGEPDLTLVSLDSTLAQETEDNRNGNNSSPFTSVSVMTTSGSAPADSTSLISTSCPLTTTPTSTTQSSGYMNVMFRDPTTGSQVQESLGRSDGDVESEIVHESDANVPNAPASELHGTTPHQHGIGARPKQVKFEITGESSESGRCRTVEQQCDDTMDSSHQDSDFISINVQHIDGSSTDEYEGLSLREAFMKKKRDFIEASEKRKKKAEEKAKRSAAKCQQQQQQQHSSLGKTLASWKKSRKLNNQPAAKRRDPTTVVERTSEQRKKDEREMKARTSRLYGRLEEVKQRKLEEERKRQYAENREKAKAFYQKLEKHKKS